MYKEKTICLYKICIVNLFFCTYMEIDMSLDKKSVSSFCRYNM